MKMSVPLLACVVGLLWPAPAGAQLVSHEAVLGVDVERVELVDRESVSRLVPWSALSTTALLDGQIAAVHFKAPRGAMASLATAVEIPACANLLRVEKMGKGVAGGSRPVVFDVRSDESSEVTLRLKVTPYERRVACSSPPRFGTRETTLEGLGRFTFASVHGREGGGEAVVFIPRGHDMKRPSALLVGLHPWNGSVWTYAAYSELLREAQAKDVLLLMPSGLGNSLYTAHAEDEVLTAIDELSRAVAVDRRRVSLWGASMGGAGATTIGFHHPDRFASITSFFGDSKYDLSTYVKSILPDQAAAHRVNALDVVDNARNVPVWLLHGEADNVSPIAQSVMLDRALRQRGFAVRFDRVSGMGHEGPLVTKFIAEVVDRAADARAPDAPRRVSFVSIGPSDANVYGIRLLRAGPRLADGDASIDLEKRDDGVHVLRARGVRAVLLPRGAFGAPPSTTLPIVVDDPAAAQVDVRWDALL